MRKVPITARHFFHWRFEQELWWFAGILFCILCVAAVLALSQEVFYFGLILGCTVIMYLWLVNNLPANKANQWFFKEIYVALIYTAGIWGSVWVQAGCVKPVQWVLAMLFGITALLNLLIFSYYELEEDRIQSQRSVVIAWGKSKVNAGCVWLFILFGVTALLLACSHLQKTEQRVLLIECLMAAILLLLFVFPAFFSKEYRYRWIGDGIFLLPGFALF
jgi:4-hydroxybenzoate polyprenyltransferase